MNYKDNNGWTMPTAKEWSNNQNSKVADMPFDGIVNLFEELIFRQITDKTRGNTVYDKSYITISNSSVRDMINRIIEIFHIDTRLKTVIFPDILYNTVKDIEDAGYKVYVSNFNRNLLSATIEISWGIYDDEPIDIPTTRFGKAKSILKGKINEMQEKITQK